MTLLYVVLPRLFTYVERCCWWTGCTDPLPDVPRFVGVDVIQVYLLRFVPLFTYLPTYTRYTRSHTTHLFAVTLPTHTLVYAHATAVLRFPHTTGYRIHPARCGLHVTTFYTVVPRTLLHTAHRYAVTPLVVPLPATTYTYHGSGSVTHTVRDTPRGCYTFTFTHRFTPHHTCRLHLHSPRLPPARLHLPAVVPHTHVVHTTPHRLFTRHVCRLRSGCTPGSLLRVYTYGFTHHVIHI